MHDRISYFRLCPVRDIWEGNLSPYTPQTLHPTLSVLRSPCERAAAVPDDGGAARLTPWLGSTWFTNNHHHVFQPPLVNTRGTTTGKSPIATSNLG